MITYKKFTLLFLIGVFLSSCAVTKKKPKKSTKATQTLFHSSKRDLQRGKQKNAILKLKSIIENEPDSDLADDAAIELGHYYFKKKKYEKSYDYYISVEKSEFISPKKIDSMYYASRSLYYLDRLDSASSLLNKALKIKPITNNKQLRLHTLLYQIAQRQGDLVDSLISLIFLSENHHLQSKRSAYKDRSIKLIEQTLADKDLNYVSSNEEFKQYRGYAMNRLAEKNIEEDDPDDAIYYFQGVIRHLPNSDYSARAQKYLDQRSSLNNVDGKTIGVVLPLSGRHKKIGYKALRGIQKALGVFDTPRSPYKLAIMDSEGNPEVAKRAVEKLLIENESIAIIGSLLSKTANAVAEVSHSLGVASIALSQKSPLNHLGETVFQNALTSKIQIAHLTKVAMEDLQLKKFAILYPNDPYGVEFANTFWDFISARGGEITGIQSYASNETDFKNPIRRLVGTFYIEDRIDEYKHNLKKWYTDNPRLNRRHQPPEDQLTPIKDFDAIFIPDTTKRLGMITSMLKYNDVPETYLLGTNLWNSKSLIKRNKTFLEKTVFVDIPAVKESTFKDSRFYTGYVDTFNLKPGSFEVRAYESASIIRSIIDSGINDRAGVISRLKEIYQFPGVTGNISTTPSGELSKPLQALTVKNKVITNLETLEKKF